ncbi:MAG: hypothetical protein MK066_03030 [Crocinitomicaceae bacterium]|nr:hypothetical protein [Crocinitomicaceae bacterium]
MRALLILILALFIGQFVATCSVNLLPKGKSEFVLDLEEEKEDGEKEVEKEIDEMIQYYSTFKAQTPQNCGENNIRFLATNAEYQKVYLSTPYSPPDVTV